MKKKLLLIFLAMLPFITFSQGSGNTIYFDGVDKTVSCGTISPNIGNSDFTVECWALFNSFASTGGVISAFSTVDGGWAIRQKTNSTIQFILGTGTSGANAEKLNSPALATNKWYHITCIKRGATVELYINGELVNSSASTRVVPFHNLEFGKRHINQASGYHEGLIDEVRIWNKALSQTEIRAWMCKKLTSSHSSYSDLVGFYNFDEGTGLVLPDLSSNSNDGTLVNSPTWPLSGAPIGDECIYILNPVASSSLNLTHVNNTTLTATVSSGSANSLYIYRVDAVPNSTTYPSNIYGFTQTYYGVKSFGSNGLVYSINYDYSNITGINNPNLLRLCSRPDNAQNVWLVNYGANDTLGGNLDIFGQTGTEFILGTESPDNALPIELISFTAESLGKHVAVNWTTVSETNNDFFLVQRSINGADWEDVETIDAIGNSSQNNYYSITDENPYAGTSYYRLKQVDEDEQFEYSIAIAIERASIRKNSISISPNPTNSKIDIIGDAEELEDIRLLNSVGQEVLNPSSFIRVGDSKVIIDLSQLENGVYILKTKNNANFVKKQ